MANAGGPKSHTPPAKTGGVITKKIILNICNKNQISSVYLHNQNKKPIMKPAQLTRMRVEHYTGSFKANKEILQRGGAVRTTTVHGSGRWSSYYKCQYPHSLTGWDLVELNDAPRGGALGNYIAATKPGDKTVERAEFVRQFRKQHRAYVHANMEENIIAEINRRIYLISNSNAHRIYEYEYVLVKDGKAIAAFWKTTTPDYVDSKKWDAILNRYLTEKFGTCYLVRSRDFEPVAA